MIFLIACFGIVIHFSFTRIYLIGPTYYSMQRPSSRILFPFSTSTNNVSIAMNTGKMHVVHALRME